MNPVSIFEESLKQKFFKKLPKENNESLNDQKRKVKTKPKKKQ
jgi:hypothetical protein